VVILVPPPLISTGTIHVLTLATHLSLPIQLLESNIAISLALKMSFIIGMGFVILHVLGFLFKRKLEAHLQDITAIILAQVLSIFTGTTLALILAIHLLLKPQPTVANSVMLPVITPNISTLTAHVAQIALSLLSQENKLALNTAIINLA